MTSCGWTPPTPPTSLRGERAESLVITVSHTGPEIQTSVCNKQPEESLLHPASSLLCRHCGEQAPCWTCTVFGTEGAQTSQNVVYHVTHTLWWGRTACWHVGTWSKKDIWKLYILYQLYNNISVTWWGSWTVCSCCLSALTLTLIRPYSQCKDWCIPNLHYRLHSD